MKAPVALWKTFVRSKTFSHEVEFLEENDEEDGDGDGEDLFHGDGDGDGQVLRMYVCRLVYVCMYVCN